MYYYNKVLGKTNDFLTPVIVKYIENNLDIMKSRYLEHILPIPWLFIDFGAPFRTGRHHWYRFLPSWTFFLITKKNNDTTLHWFQVQKYQHNIKCKVTKALFLRRRVLPEKRATLRDNFLESSYMRKKLKPLPRPTALTQSLIRELKQLRRRPQRRLQKNNKFNDQNNSSARASSFF